MTATVDVRPRLLLGNLPYGSDSCCHTFAHHSCNVEPLLREPLYGSGSATGLHHIVNVGRLSLGFSGVFQCLGWSDGFWEKYCRGGW